MRRASSSRHVPRPAPRRPHGRRTTRSRLVANRRNIVHVADPLAEEGLALLRARCEVRPTTGLKEADLAARVADNDALPVRGEAKDTPANPAEAQAGLVRRRAGAGAGNAD